jgi:hypothetical protein
MSWFWLNIPLATLFFLAWTLIPLWLVFKHPEPGPRALTGVQAPAGKGSSPTSLRADHAQVDVSESAWPAADQPGDPRPGIAAGPREPGLGIPQGARRAAPARSPHQRIDRAADLARQPAAGARFSGSPR